MKNLFLITIFFCFTIFCESQDTIVKENLRYHAFSISPLSIYFDSSTSGFAFSADVSFSYKKNIFSMSFNAGQEYKILGASDSFEQINLLYGREFKLNKTIYFDVFGGLGYFSFKSFIGSEDIRVTRIGVPLGTKLRFRLGKRFSLGLHYKLNFNSVNNINIAGIVLQWNK